MSRRTRPEARAAQHGIRLVYGSLPAEIEAAFGPVRGGQPVAVANDAHPTRTREQCVQAAVDLALRNVGRP